MDFAAVVRAPDLHEVLVVWRAFLESPETFRVDFGHDKSHCTDLVNKEVSRHETLL